MRKISTRPTVDFNQQLRAARTEFTRPADIGKFLPPESAAKLSALRAFADQKQSEAAPAYDHMKEISAQRQQLRSRLVELDRQGVAETDASVIAIQEELGRLADEYDRVFAQRNKAKDEAEAARHVVRRCEDFVRAAGTLEAAPPETPMLKRNENFAEGVARIRAYIEQLRDRIEDALDAPRPAAEAIEIAIAAIDELAARGKPDVTPCIEFGSRPVLPAIRSSASLSIDGKVSMGAENVDILGLLAWANRDAIIDAITADIRAKARDSDAIPTKEREGTVAQLRADLLAAERQEEAIIAAGAAVGHRIERRRDTDVRAVLGLADDAGDQP